ncbi:MAG: hypothetical protein ACXADB_02865 [Candidatus Hermodarchaeia archaeon]|jgi:hypothetical protein
MNNATIVAGLLSTALVTGSSWVAWVAGGYCGIMILVTVWNTINE